MKDIFFKNLIFKERGKIRKELFDMRIFSTYSAKIKNYNHIFKKTVSVYREAVDFMIQVCLQKWEDIRKEDYLCSPVIYVERLCHRTKRNPEVSYESFDRKFYKLPSYLRRSAISDAIGKVSSLIKVI